MHYNQCNFIIHFRPVKNVVNTLDEEDDDVKEERQRVISGTSSATDAMRLVNLTKVILQNCCTYNHDSDLYSIDLW